MTRKEALCKIKIAFENNELGFQRFASGCRYYDRATNSHCAVGILIGKDIDLMDLEGNIDEPFAQLNGAFYSIENSMIYLEMDTFHGLDISELNTLQSLHDDLVGTSTDKNKLLKFETYLYSLAV